MSLLSSIQKKLQPELITWRRALHQRAEVGYDLEKTRSYIASVLKKYHMQPKSIAGGFIVDIGQGEDHVILRADMDALPMEENSGLSFASKTQAAHTCGHDLHATMLLGAAVYLKHHEHLAQKRMRLIFQADEEGITGAKKMIHEGALEGNFKAAFALHVSPILPTGSIYYRSGAYYASSDVLDIFIKGQGGHGASPHTAIDPIWCGNQVYQNLQSLVSREKPPAEMMAFSICTMHSGSLFNIIPSTLTMSGTLRTYNEDLRQYMLERMHQIVEEVCRSNRCQGRLSLPLGTPTVYNNPTITDEIVTLLENELPKKQILQQKEPFSWSEDFGVYAQILPSSMMTIGAQVKGYDYGLHTPEVIFNEDAMPYGVLAHIIASQAEYKKR